MKNRNWAVYLLQEIVIVVLGVLIAVSINNYKENRDETQYVEKMLFAIEQEVRSSKMDVDSVLETHVRLMDSLEHNLDNNQETLVEMITRFGGIKVPLIQNVGLRFYISNKAELVDFELISLLLEIEFISNLLDQKMNKFYDFAYQHLNDTDEEVKISFAYMLSDAMETERSLLKKYTQFLDSQEGPLQ